MLLRESTKKTRWKTMCFYIYCCAMCIEPTSKQTVWKEWTRTVQIEVERNARKNAALSNNIMREQKYYACVRSFRMASKTDYKPLKITWLSSQTSGSQATTVNSGKSVTIVIAMNLLNFNKISSGRSELVQNECGKKNCHRLQHASMLAGTLCDSPIPAAINGLPMHNG